MKNWFVVIVLFAGMQLHAQMDEEVLLIARNTGEKVVANGDTIRTMGFAFSLGENPDVPGPTLEFNEGDSVEIDLWNVSQGAPHTIHLHGLDVDQENDGVPHLSFDVPHMEHGYYKFKAPHAGTYLYHCHVVSSIHVQAGMYGLIIIHPPDGSKTTWDGGYPYDISMSLLMSEIDTIWHNDTILLHDHDPDVEVHEVELPVYDPQYYLVNGLSDGQIPEEDMALNTSVGAVNYVRLINLGYKGNRVIFPAEFDAEIVASDGRPFPTVENSDTVYIYPGERYGVLGTMPAEGLSSITIEYFDLNTAELEDTQEVPIVTEGYVSTTELATNYELLVKPNPFENSFSIEADLKEKSEIEIVLLDLRGNIIDVIQKPKKMVGSVSFEYTNPTLASGVYLIQMRVNDEVRLNRKIIKN